MTLGRAAALVLDTAGADNSLKLLPMRLSVSVREFLREVRRFVGRKIASTMFLMAFGAVLEGNWAHFDHSFAWPSYGHPCWYKLLSNIRATSLCVRGRQHEAGTTRIRLGNIYRSDHPALHCHFSARSAACATSNRICGGSSWTNHGTTCNCGMVSNRTIAPCPRYRPLER